MILDPPHHHPDRKKPPAGRETALVRDKQEGEGE